MISNLSNKASKLVIDNSPAILTGIGVVGLGITTWLTARAAFQASDRLAVERMTRAVEASDLSKSEKFAKTWTLYIPAATSLVLTGGCIVMANRVASQRAAALAAGYALLSDRFEEYRNATLEKLGVKKEEEMRVELDKGRVNANMPSTVVMSDGMQWFYDINSDRPFENTMEGVKSAANDVNYQINSKGSATLNDFYGRLGLGYVPMYEEMGWDRGHLIEIIPGVMNDDKGRAVHTIDFLHGPTRGFRDHRDQA